jgi:hypothetical protein
MKRSLLILSVLFLSVNIFAQYNFNSLRQNQGMLEGGMGLNWIDGELYYSFHFMPELSFSKIGVGLDLNFDINKNGNIRKENFNEFSDYLSVIRYVRYGQKNEPVFVKLGALDYYTLGHGSIMYMYNNRPSYDSRKNGLVLDLDFGNFGFESIYGAFGESGVVGIRGHILPLKYTSAGDIPVIGSLEAGLTYATDFNDKAGVLAGSYDKTSRTFKATKDNGSTNIYGFDLGLPLLKSQYLGINLYYDFATIQNFGSGSALGLMFNVNGLGLFSGSLKFERRFNGKNYMAGYFNSLYEVERFKLDTSSNSFTSKALALNNIDAENGFYGELGINVLGFVNILGSYQRLDKIPTSGILHLITDLSPKDGSFVLRAGYDKTNIIDEKDLFTLDDRSFLYTEIGYKPVPYIVVSMLYNWTFTPVRDKDDKIIDFKPQKKIEPRISFVYPFDLGGK